MKIHHRTALVNNIYKYQHWISCFSSKQMNNKFLLNVKLLLALVLMTVDSAVIVDPFQRPCPDNIGSAQEFSSGIFQCKIDRAPLCVDACVKSNCDEWSLNNISPPYDSKVWSNVRCKCLQEMNICHFYELR